MLSIYSCGFLAICRSLEKWLVRSNTIFWLIFCFFDIEQHELFVYLQMLCKWNIYFIFASETTPCQLFHLQIFSPTLRVVFLFCLCFPLLWRRWWHPTAVLLPGKFHGQRSPVGCSPCSCKKLDTTERLHFHFSLLCIGEGNGNPLQCSCLENPRNGGAWWAVVSGVAQNQTRLKRLSSSSYSELGLSL